MDKDPYSEINFIPFKAQITDKNGELIFNESVEFPDFFDQNDVAIVASKYLCNNAKKKETSFKEMVDRVSETIANYGLEDGYFENQEEYENFLYRLKYYQINQFFAFNSPVYFNIGLNDNPQLAACQPYHARINTPSGLIKIGNIVDNNKVGMDVYDDEGITQIVACKNNGKKEVFRVTLRNGIYIDVTADHIICASDNNKSITHNWIKTEDAKINMYMKMYYKNYNSIIGFEDINDSEAALIGWLQTDGFVGKYDHKTGKSWIIEFNTINDEEYKWVNYHLNQVFPENNFNIISVPTQDEKVDFKRFRAYGYKYEKFILKYELYNRKIDKRVPEIIFLSNDNIVCSYLKSIFQADGYISIREKTQSGVIGLSSISEYFIKDVQLLLARLGIFSSYTTKKDERTNRHNSHVLSITYMSNRKLFEKLIGFISKDKIQKLQKCHLLKGKEVKNIKHLPIKSIKSLGIMDVYDIQTKSGKYLTNNILVHNCFILDIQDNMDSISNILQIESQIFKHGSGSGINLSKLRSSKEKVRGGGTASGPCSFLKVEDINAGVIRSGGTLRRSAKLAVLNVDHPDVEEFISCKKKEEDKLKLLVEGGINPENGYDMTDHVFYQNTNLSVRLFDDFMRRAEKDRPYWTKYVLTGEKYKKYKAKDLLWKIAELAHESGCPGLQFHDTVNKWHTCKNSGEIVGTNPCGEYLFINNTSCNLASINLLKLVIKTNNIFNYDLNLFADLVSTIITAQDILVDRGSYPNTEIAKNTKDFRALGLGYSNLGSLLMYLGLPYDSDDGRKLASSITACMNGLAFLQSNKLAIKKGSFNKFSENKESYYDVLKKHIDAGRELSNKESNKEIITNLISNSELIYDELEKLVEQDAPFRNAQTTLLAPTGCLNGESYVLTSDGILEIKEMCPNITLYENNLTITDDMRWQNINYNIIQENKITNADQFYYNGKQDTIIISTEHGYSIEGTRDHKFRIVTEDGEYIWKKLSDINIDDQIVIRKGGHEELLFNKEYVELKSIDLYQNKNKIELPKYLDEDLALILGYYMGNGILHDDGVRLVVGDLHITSVEELSKCFNNVFNMDISYTEPNSNCKTYYFNSKNLVRFFRENNFSKDKGKYGEGAASAFIPTQILKSKTSVLCSFLRGYFDADGTINNKNNIIEAATVSYKLSKQIQVCLTSLGICCVLKETNPKPGFSKIRRPLYRLRIRSIGDAVEFKNKIGFISNIKQERLNKLNQQVKTGNVLYGEKAWTDFRNNSGNIGFAQRANISVRIRQKQGSLHWAKDMIEKYPNLKNSKIAKLIDLNIVLSRVKTKSYGSCETYDISVPFNNTYIANNFVSHNTISFQMGCKTTGIEPEYLLIKNKTLSGNNGAKILMENSMISESLSNLGYVEKEIKKIQEYLHRDYHLENCPILKPEHLPIFDTAQIPTGGSRHINHMAHIKMVAEVQPFLSGSVSKTINMPKDCTIQDVYDLYFAAWKMGLKGITIYRDESKNFQPLGSGNGKSTKSNHRFANRKKLPDERDGKVKKFKVGITKGYIIPGLYEDGSLGEVFVQIAKQGSTLSGLLDSWATTLSIALQYGVPLKDLVRKLMLQQFDPSGFTGDPDFPQAKSIIDYIVSYLGLKYLSEEEQKEIGLISKNKQTYEKNSIENLSDDDKTISLNGYEFSSSAPACNMCGTMMLRKGSCYLCVNCGTNEGSCG